MYQFKTAIFTPAVSLLPYVGAVQSKTCLQCNIVCLYCTTDMLTYQRTLSVFYHYTESPSETFHLIWWVIVWISTRNTCMPLGDPNMLLGLDCKTYCWLWWYHLIQGFVLTVLPSQNVLLLGYFIAFLVSFLSFYISKRSGELVLHKTKWQLVSYQSMSY